MQIFSASPSGNAVETLHNFPADAVTNVFIL